MINLLRSRRSIRKFSSHPISEELIDQLKEALLRSPSSRSIMPWEFIFISKKNSLETLSASKQAGSQFLKGAPLGVVVCADETQSDVWVEDCSIAAITLQYVAEELGLGSCWIQIRKRKHHESLSSEDYVRQQLQLPPHIRIASIIALGYPAESKPGHPKESLKYQKIRMDES